VGLSLTFWTLGLVIAGSQLAVYVALASYFPNRPGAEVVYLEQAYPRPKYLLPTAFAVRTDRGTLRLATCGIYYASWTFILPHLSKYRIRQEVLLLSDETSKAHRLVKIPLEELEVWDREHDVLGQRINLLGQQSDDGGNEVAEKKEV
jgi:hypothetical protein